jgi:steroid delta-isomerase-like uncharacterized protein
MMLQDSAGFERSDAEFGRPAGLPVEDRAMRRLVTPLIALVLLLAALVVPATRLFAQEATPSTGTPEALARSYVEDLLNRGDQGMVDQVLTPDFVLHLNSSDIPTAEGFKGFLTGLHVAFPDVNYAIQDIAIDGNRAVVRWTVSGTQKGVFNGIPATNKPIVNVPGVSWLLIKDGRIAEAWVVVDTLGLLTQLGVIPGAQPAATPAA